MRVLTSSRYIFALAAVCLLTSCSEQKESDKRPLTADNELGLFLNPTGFPTVVDMNGQPIAGAKVMIGQALDQPFANNMLATSADGSFAPPAEWTGEETLTIDAPGFVRTTFLRQSATSAETYQLRPSEEIQSYELKGQGSGFNIKNGDGQIDFAIVVPAFSRSDLFSLNLGKVISSDNDTISVAGQKLEVPSNIALPTQKESYFISITLNKPQYRTYFSSPGAKLVQTLRGQFPLKKVVDQFRAGKGFFDVINDFKLQGGSLNQINITDASTSLDLPVNQLSFNQVQSFPVPAVPANYTLLAVAASETNGTMLLTDIKNVTGMSTGSLATAAGGTPYLALAMKNKKDPETSVGQLSAALVPLDGSVANPTLLPVLDTPTVTAGKLSWNAISSPAEIAPVATYVSLSKMATRMQDKVAMEIPVKVWEIYSNNWETEVQLPEWPNDTAISGKKRWDVTLVGKQDGQRVLIGPSLLESATHATHSSVDF